MNKIREQFNALATHYDKIKDRNPCYLEALKNIFITQVPDAKSSSVIEIGCGTGEILGAINPRYGVGVDISEKMISMAKNKFPRYSFFCQQLEELMIKDLYDYIVLPDIIEYVSELDKALQCIRQLCKASTKIIITSPNPFWEFALKVAENLNLKMRDSVSKKHPKEAVFLAAQRQNFKIEEYSTRLLIPINIFYSGWVNKNFHRLPFIKNFGFIQVFVLRPCYNNNNEHDRITVLAK